MIDKIILTGPESCGKSTLAHQIANHFQLPIVVEVAREYLQEIDRPYNLEDLQEIAIIQEEQEEKYLKSICDTDLLTLYIWKMEVFNLCDIKWLKSLSDGSPKKHYLLCKPDLPWEPDPLRENPNDRDRLFDVYIEALELIGLSYSVVEGLGSSRFNHALEHLQFMKIK